MNKFLVICDDPDSAYNDAAGDPVLFNTQKEACVAIREDIVDNAVLAVAYTVYEVVNQFKYNPPSQEYGSLTTV